VALGDTVTHAQKAAYRLAENIHWDRIYYRKDIGHRAIARETAGD
jgi:phosphoribosylamine--glycine ligase